MIRFSKDFPEKLRSTILISEVVGKRVALKKRGHEFIGLCPFHSEKSPSFTVNDQKGFYHCFGCSAHGDVIGFVMNSEGLEFRDAVERLAQDFGIEITRVKFDENKEEKLSCDYLILEKSTQFFEKNLHGSSGTEARSYLAKRGLNSSSAKKFRLGFALNSYEALTNFLVREGFSETEIGRTGIIGKNDRGKIYDKFRNRITFPITNKKGKIIAFGGRTIGDDMPKYLNSSETDLFKKNQTLYNLANARKSTFDKGFAVVVEGYMDVISLSTKGIENVVAGLGTALGAEHLKELFHFTDKVVICLDGDTAGIRAAKRFSEIALPLINARKNISFTFLPNQMDPDDFVKNFGAKELEKMFVQATPLSESLLDFAFAEVGVDRSKKISAENKAKIEANLASRIAAIPDYASRKYFSLFIKDSLFSLGRGQKKSPTNLTKITATPAKNLAENLAKNIIALIIKFPELARFRDDMFDITTLHLSIEKFTHLKELVLENADLSEPTHHSYLQQPSEQHSHASTPHRMFEYASGADHSNAAHLTRCSEMAGRFPEFLAEMREIENIVASLEGVGLDSSSTKLRLLLLKDLLLQVEAQYKESLNKIDEIETGKTTISDPKIKEIFDYKNSIQTMIYMVEKELI